MTNREVAKIRVKDNEYDLHTVKLTKNDIKNLKNGTTLMPEYYTTEDFTKPIECLTEALGSIQSILIIATAVLANRKIRKQSTEIQKLNEVLGEWESPLTHVEMWRKVNINGGPIKYVDKALSGGLL